MQTYRRFVREADLDAYRCQSAAGAGRSYATAKARHLAVLATLIGALISFTSCTTPGGTTSRTCHTVADCTSASAPICDATTLSCRACTPGQQLDDTACTNGHPGTPRCGPSGACVECLSSADCTQDPIAKPACSANACGKCTQPSDCQSMVCSADGTCAQVTDVLFVNNMNGSCEGSGHQGSKSDPYCSVQQAIDAAGNAGKTMISVGTSTHPYDAISITATAQTGQSGTLYISGASTDLGAVVIEGADSTPALTVSPVAGKQVTAVLTNLELVGSRAGYGVLCQNSANLTLQGVRVHDSSTDGINSTGCTLTVDRVRIYNNYRGMFITGGKYAISNVMIWLNKSSGIAFGGGGSSGSVQFATIYGNGNVANVSPAGIDCGASPLVIDYSIVYNNIATNSSGALTTDLQLNGCSLNQVVTNDNKAVGGTFTQMVDFVNTQGSSSVDAVDLHLRSDSTADKTCCIDKISATAAISNHDIDNHPRPAGIAADIGAHEVQ